VLAVFPVLWAGHLQAVEVDVTPEAQARQIVEETGVKGGLIVHVGCGKGKRTAGLRVNDRYLVQGLDSDPENVKEAREYIRDLGVYGPVSADRLWGDRFPYADNLVNLVVVEEPGAVAPDEIMRVLCPGGVACIRQGDSWRKQIKPWPTEIDEWTHCLHSPDNNAISSDAVVGPPRTMQWVAGPRRSRQQLAKAGGGLPSRWRRWSTRRVTWCSSAWWRRRRRGRRGRRRRAARRRRWSG
jgi:SAM-dependent methyltransferase